MQEQINISKSRRDFIRKSLNTIAGLSVGMAACILILRRRTIKGVHKGEIFE